MTICNMKNHGEIVYDSAYRYCPACGIIEKLLSDIQVLGEEIQELLDEQAGSSL